MYSSYKNLFCLKKKSHNWQLSFFIYHFNYCLICCNERGTGINYVKAFAETNGVKNYNSLETLYFMRKSFIF